MSTIILAPYPAKLFSGSRNPKEYPWWPEVVRQLLILGHRIVQIGVAGEQRIEGVSEFILPRLDEITDIINNADTWLTVDSFLPHYCHTYNLKSGVVIWSLSDPAIWGHKENINLLKSRTYLRSLQFKDWMSEAYNPDAFVSPEEVVAAVQAKLGVA